MSRRALVLVDGEHLPEAIRDALADLATRGTRPVVAVFVGGTEKVGAIGGRSDLGCPTVWPLHPELELPRVIAEAAPDVVVDLSSHPIVDDVRRRRLAAIVLHAGVPFEAPGVRYQPLPRPRLTQRPTVAVIATGKRTGKTALSGALARHVRDGGRTPVVVAMGRGGPGHPVVVPAGTGLTTDRLLAIADAGQHAASDFYEDAVISGVATVGCRRVGEGPTGEVAHSNVPAGVAAAEQLGPDLVVLEGSGAAVPPAAADATMLVVPATLDPVVLPAALPLRFLLADVVVLTMADPRLVPSPRVERTVAAVRELLAALRGGQAGRAVPIVATRFVPAPVEDVAGARVFVATTAPTALGEVLTADLQRELGVEVVGATHALADRAALRAALDAAPDYDVLLTELKAAAIDTAARAARSRGARTVLYDNRPVGVDPGVVGVGADLTGAFDHLLDRAEQHERTEIAT